MAGASAGLALSARLRGNDELARRAWPMALAGIAVSPPLLISDLGVPARFLNMLRVFKVTSPMSVGSWMLSASGCDAVAAAHAGRALVPSPPAVARATAARARHAAATYTAALIANTAVPVWHEARRELPFVFAASGASGRRGRGVATPPRAAGPGTPARARRRGRELAA